MATPYTNGAAITDDEGMAIAPSERAFLPLGGVDGVIVSAPTAVAGPVSVVVAPLAPNGDPYPSGVHEQVAVATGLVASGAHAKLVDFTTAPGAQFGVAVTNQGAATHIFNVNVL